jgi:PAS domain S-box-containing protein
MRTTLLITNSPQFERDLRRLFAGELHIAARTIPAADVERAAARIAAELDTMDAIVIDLPSLASISKKLVDTFAAATNQHPVIVRIRADQTGALPLPDAWQVALDTDPPPRLRRLLRDALAHRELARHAEQLQKLTAHQQQLLSLTRPNPAAESSRAFVSVAQYRESLKEMSRLFSDARDVKTLAARFLGLLRDQMGLTKLALFIRPSEPLNTDPTERDENAPWKPAAVLSMGPNADRARELTLTPQEGIGRFLAADGKILRRQQILETMAYSFDPQLIREFELLGAEYAVPVQNGDSTLGALTFNGKITSEPITTEELEFIFSLCNTLGTAIRNLWMTAQIATQQRFNADVLANIQSGIVVVNDRNEIVLVNDRLCELLGLPRADAGGRDLSWLPPAVADVIFESLRLGKNIPQREVTLPQSERALGVTTTRFPDAANRNCVVALVDDITQTKHQQRLAREAQTTQFWLQLASRLSHELRNSLVAIRTFSQLLPEKYSDASFRDDFSRMMVGEIERVNKFVDEITFFAHPLELKSQLITVTDIIESAIGRVCAEIWKSAGADGDFSNVKPTSIVTPKGKNVLISRHFTHTVATINADKQRLEDSLVHLIRNALQAMQDKGGRLSVGTEDVADAESAPCGVKISVTDTGDGIALPDLEKVFQPFYTTRNVGVGLGLTIVQKTVEAHNGRVEVTSKLGKGTTMNLFLPVNRDVDLTARALSGAKPSPPARSEPVIHFAPPARS